MIKRPLNPQFRQAVLDGRKFTTIRDKPWPVGVPIMLYNWAGAPYRSKQIDVAPVIVRGYWAILIYHGMDGEMAYAYGMKNNTPIHETEGFASRQAMDDWFRPLVKRGDSELKYLMRFKLKDGKPKPFTGGCKTEDDCKTPMWCRNSEVCPLARGLPTGTLEG